MEIDTIAQNPVADLFERYSLEMTAKDLPVLAEARLLIPHGTQVSITDLEAETVAGRVAAAAAVRRAGWIPVPHIAARRITSEAALRQFLNMLQAEATTECVFLIAGDNAQPDGPFEDTMSVIRSGLLQENGIKRVGIGGYPEGHPLLSETLLWQALHEKSAALVSLGLEYEITTQFAFDADAVLDWLARLRREGITAPVRIGVPGPTNVRTLLRFAARCGVGASVKILAKYGISVTQLLGTAGPDRLLDRLIAGLSPEIHGEVSLHLYALGGFTRTAAWAQTNFNSR